MSSSPEALEVLEAEVLKLAPADRSHLLERLVASLDLDPEVEAAWEREADRREAELESGAVAAIPGHEAMARLRSRLSRSSETRSASLSFDTSAESPATAGQGGS